MQRFQLLYRPSISNEQTPHRYPQSRPDRPIARNVIPRDLTASTTTVTLDNGSTHGTLDDAPPKYTPPPSYTTATGARIAKMLRNSIRRSVRRLVFL